MRYVKNIQTNTRVDKIDYEYLKKLFRGLLNKHTTRDVKFEYDWVNRLKNLKNCLQMAQMSLAIFDMHDRGQDSKMIGSNFDTPLAKTINDEKLEELAKPVCGSSSELSKDEEDSANLSGKIPVTLEFKSDPLKVSAISTASTQINAIFNRRKASESEVVSMPQLPKHTVYYKINLLMQDHPL